MFSWLKGISAGGDVVGRDKITTNILPNPTQMELLSQNYKNERANNITTDVIIDELNHYRNEKEEIRDITEKLTEAGFEYLIPEAEELKELVTKIIIKNQHYKSAQKMITFLLAEVESIFNTSIKPKLDGADSEVSVKGLFREYLEYEIQSHLGENVLEIFNRQINGMVFFLTGNCRLEWQ